MPDEQRIRVVYVEDDPFFSETVNRNLTAAGFPTAIAKSGDAALELIKTEKPELVLLDVILPKMDGKEVLRRLKADPKTKHIPVIVLSNLSAEENSAEFRALGAAEFMVKAMALPETIVEKVKAHLSAA
ncbi:MAG: response regulator [Patescibacteria group bacterium]|nr:response regulator [Patescibacteria group bacterium]